MNKPIVKLIGEDGNAFYIISACKQAWLKSGRTKEDWLPIQEKMMSGDYNNLLCIANDYFTVT